MTGVEMKDICKSYDGKVVLDRVSACFLPGKVYCIMGPSGQGKTTFLRILAGLEKADSGQVIIKEKGCKSGEMTGKEKIRMSGVFQEDRLCEEADAVANVAMVLRRRDGRAYAVSHLEKLLPADSLKKTVSQLSGGMRRRVAIARAMAADSELVFMDEPFTGLDETTRKKVIRYILEIQNGRTLIIVTHQPEDVDALKAERIEL